MKKFITTLIAALMIGAMLTACGSSGDVDTSSDIDSAPTQTVTATSEENDLSALEGLPLTEAMSRFDELGYTATYYADGVDFTEFIDDLKEDYTTGEIKINDTDKTAEVTLVLTSNIEANEAEKALSEKLETGAAWSAAEKYGKTLYGDEFDLNYLTGKIAEEADDEDTWFLKAECEVNGDERTCEAKVTGTTNDPEIISFDIY